MSLESSGSVVAPDEPFPGVQPEHTPEDAAKQIEELQAAIEKPRPIPDPRERARTKREVKEHREELSVQEDPPMRASDARSALAMMLSSSRPPSLERDTFEIKRLSRQIGGCDCEAGHHPEEGCEGTPFIITLSGLPQSSTDELEELALRKPTDAERERGQMQPILDRNRFNRLLVSRALVEPSLRDPELQSAYGNPEEIVRAWFNTGEIGMLSGRVTELSGFADGAVVKAKKS